MLSSNSILIGIRLLAVYKAESIPMQPLPAVIAVIHMLVTYPRLMPSCFWKERSVCIPIKDSKVSAKSSITEFQV